MYSVPAVMSESMHKSSSFLEPSGFQLRKRKRKNLVEDLDNNSSILNSSTSDLSQLGSNGVESKRKKTLSKVTSMASMLSTPMVKAFNRSVSSVRLSGSPAPRISKSSIEYPGLSGMSTPGKFFTRSSSVVKVLQQQNSNTPESPLLKRGGVGRSSSTNLTPYKKPGPTPTKQRNTKYWSEKYPETSTQISRQEVKLQEAIFELSTGEEDLVQDMNLLRKTYAETMVRFKILNQAEADLVFGKLYPIIPLHNSLACALSSLRDRGSGLCKPLGKVALHWVATLRDSYVDYCGNLIQTKAFIDFRRDTDKDFTDFLQRCIESPFSRKLDLWSYLDVPRSRLVKYPLLLRQVLKFSNATSEFAADMNNLNSAIENLEGVIREVDIAMAQARANFTVSRLEWLDEAVETKAMAFVYNAREEVISGTLRNNRGTKLECYLLDTVLILGRPSSRLSVVQASSSTTSLASQSSSTASLCSLASTTSNHSSKDSALTSGSTAAAGAAVRPTAKRLQVYRTPIPTHDLVWEDLNPVNTISGSFNDSISSVTGATNGKGGSFKSAFSGSGQPSKNGFRVSFRNPSDGQAHTLFAPDEHSKKQWLAALKKLAPQEDSTTNDEPIIKPCLTTETDCGTPTPSKRMYSINGKVAKNSPRVGLFLKNRRSPRIKASLSHTALESVRSGTAVKKIRSSASLASAKKLQNQENKSDLLKSNSALKVQRGSSSTSKLPPPVPFKMDISSPPPTPPPRGLKRDTSKGCLVAAAVGRRIVRQQLNSSLSKASPSLKICSRSRLPPPVPPKSNNVRNNSANNLRKIAGPRTQTIKNRRNKSWGHLQQEKNASYHGESHSENAAQQKRYITRSTAKKVSKSMSDLMEM